MSIELEYAVKKDIRNHPVVRQADVRQRVELRWMLALASFIVLILLFSSLQHFRMFDTGARIERLRVAYESELDINRQLRLNLAALQSLDRLADRASEVGLRPATLADTIVIERIRQPLQSGSVVASAR